MSAVVLAGLVALVAGVLIYVRADLPSDGGPDPGPAAAEAFSREYVARLNSDDPSGLAALLGEPPESAAVVELFGQYGGLGLAHVDVVVAQEFPNVYRTWITAVAADGSPVEMYHVIEWDGHRWSLALPRDGTGG